MLIALLNVLSIRTEDRRLAIAFPVMKANRRAFESERRYEIKRTLQKNLQAMTKERQKHKS